MTTSLFSRTARGFTLIETIIVIALSLVMIGALTVLIRNFMIVSSYTQLSTMSATSIRTVMNEAELLIPTANRVLASYDFPDATHASSATVLVLEIPSVDSSGAIIPNAHDHAAFYTDGTYAYRTLATDAASARIPGRKQLSDTISSLTFYYNNADLGLANVVTIDAQVLQQTKDQRSTDRRREQLILRNFSSI